MSIKHMITCVIAGIDYLVHPQILGSVEESVKADQIIPVIVLSQSEVNAGPEELGRTLQYFVDHDDVCSDEFTGILVMKPSTSSLTSGNAPDALTGSFNFSTIYHLSNDLDTFSEPNDNLPSGPYFLSGSNLHQAWRLYPDDLDAFTFGMIPDIVGESTGFQAVTSQASDGISRTVPVPSRLYSKPTAKKPLAGVRVSVNDVFQVKGTKMTLSSKAWSELYSVSTTTASYVDKLMDLGAIVVGKTKTSQFGTGMDSVDFHAPINPRGDGYQKALGSSIGSVASLAGYEWLDHSIGLHVAISSGGAEVRHGLYSIRTTVRSVSSDGIKTGSRSDTIELIDRSLINLYAMTNVTVPDSAGSQVTPLKRILYLVDFFPLLDPTEQRFMDEFISVLEASSGVKMTEVSLSEVWNKTAPTDAAGQTLFQYMGDAYAATLCYEYFHAYDKFQADYRATLAKTPFAEAYPQVMWDMGATVTDESYKTYLERISTFRAWFDENIMTSDSKPTANTIMVLPADTDGVGYRGENTQVFAEQIGIEFISIVLGTPQLFIPFAQLPYTSRINKREEYRPVSASLIGPRGSDLSLIRITEKAFQAAGWRTYVETGRYTFPVADNSRHVYDGDRGKGQRPLADGLTEDQARLVL